MHGRHARADDRMGAVGITQRTLQRVKQFVMVVACTVSDSDTAQHMSVPPAGRPAGLTFVIVHCSR